MYKPPPPRPKKTNIVRSRSGCQSCRERRTKCDEKKPKCGTCLRLGRNCESVKTPLKFRVMTAESEPSLLSSRPAGPPAHSGKTPQIGNMDIIRSLQHTDRDVFYSTYWEDRCLPALHPVFHSATKLHGLPALKDAILALSSCNISRIYAEKKSSASLAIMGDFSPSLAHQTRCQLYYSSAIRRFASLTHDDYQDNVALALTVLVLFGYIEASMGNFEGFYKHVQGLSAFLEQLRERTGDPFFRALLSAWLQSQFLVWWARAYFSNLDVQRHLQPIALPRVLQGPATCLHERRVAALSIMCESHRLNVKETLKHWQCRGDADGLPEQGVGLRTEFDELQDVCSRLQQQAARLDEWTHSLPPSEQPLADGDPAGRSATEALRFRSHDAALNFGYCVVARIMQGAPFLRSVGSREPGRLGRECAGAEGWVRLLLRVARGADLRTCVTQNSYTIGFSGLLMAASLRCQDRGLGAETERWLRRLHDTQPTEEGAFPVYQTLAVVRAINQLRDAGRDVFGLSQPVDDGGGTPKFTGYNSQMITRLLVHGKSRTTGELFTESIDFGASEPS